MKISIDWLGDFLDWKESDPYKIAERITVGTAEVEDIEVQGEILTHCCIGQVIAISKHPNADTLQLCDVQTDKGVKKVVCGGTNLRDGMIVAFAHIGATVKWHGEEMMTLEKTKIRGVTSEGMICAAEELELTVHYPDAVGHSIIDMGDDDEHVGKSLKEHLGIGDTILHIDNHAITHRADLFSHIGFARECVALGLATWKKKPFDPSTELRTGLAHGKPEYKVPTFGSGSPLTSTVDIPTLVPRYLACTIDIEGVGETPDWMKKRLEAIGNRSLNLPIDITNYVAAEVGMPLHSFDAADLKGTVHFRLSKKGEKIRTLDEIERTLPEGAIVLSDDEGIFDLMGVMGGLRGSTKDTTKQIYLHSAVVDPISIRRAIIATGHRTDASTVYEKGIPLISAGQGFYRALELILDLVPGATISSALEEWGDEGKAEPISLSVERTQSILGVEISEKETVSILENLEFVVEKNSKLQPPPRLRPTGKTPATAKATAGRQNSKLSVTPPLHRLGDIKGEHDLIEEVGRMYGYDKIESTLPFAAINLPERDQRIHMLRDVLKEQGGIELVPLSFVSPDLLKKSRVEADAVQVENALGEELSLMQPSSLPRLLEHAENQLRHVGDRLATFSWGQVFEKGKGEHAELGVLVASKKKLALKDDPFLVAKQMIDMALRDVGYSSEISITKKPPAFAHPGRCADIVVNGTAVGQLFEVHPAVLANFDLPARAAACILNLSELFAISPEKVIAKTLPEFPEISYDITLTLDQSGNVGDFLKKIRGSSALLESVDVVDLYSGKSLTEGQYNLTLRCTYRALDRTLKEEEARKEFASVEKLI